MIIFAGLAMAFNFIVIYYKFIKARHADAILDMAVFIAISLMASSTVTGLQIGMIASMVVSIFFYFVPPKISKGLF